MTCNYFLFFVLVFFLLVRCLSPPKFFFFFLFFRLFAIYYNIYFFSMFPTQFTVTVHNFPSSNHTNTFKTKEMSVLFKSDTVNNLCSLTLYFIFYLYTQHEDNDAFLRVYCNFQCKMQRYLHVHHISTVAETFYCLFFIVDDDDDVWYWLLLCALSL